jgi:hypothetical protein
LMIAGRLRWQPAVAQAPRPGLPGKRGLAGRPWRRTRRASERRYWKATTR